MIQRVKTLSPEELAMKIRVFDQDVCSQLFLSELKPVLPDAVQVGKLNVYRNASEDELAELHPSDRLMVQLIKIEHLNPRWEAMLYKSTFDEQYNLLDEVWTLAVC